MEGVGGWRHRETGELEIPPAVFCPLFNRPYAEHLAGQLEGPLGIARLVGLSVQVLRRDWETVGELLFQPERTFDDQAAPTAGNLFGGQATDARPGKRAVFFGKDLRAPECPIVALVVAEQDQVFIERMLFDEECRPRRADNANRALPPVDGLSRRFSARLGRMTHTGNDAAKFFRELGNRAKELGHFITAVHIGIAQIGGNRVNHHERGLMVDQGLPQHINMAQLELPFFVFLAQPVGQGFHLGIIAFCQPDARFDGLGQTIFCRE